MWCFLFCHRQFYEESSLATLVVTAFSFLVFIFLTSPLFQLEYGNYILSLSVIYKYQSVNIYPQFGDGKCYASTEHLGANIRYMPINRCGFLKQVLSVTGE